MTTNKKNIMVLSGKRGGFGAMKQMLRSINRNIKMNLQLVLTDQHTDQRFGNTYKEVQKEFKKIDKIFMYQKNDLAINRIAALVKFQSSFSKLIKKRKPNLLILYGDRSEVLAASLVANNMLIPVAHIQGGDISGTLDEHFRHAITKLSHLHFPSILSSYKRIIKLGEKPKNVFVVGDSHLDQIYEKDYYTREKTNKILKLEKNKKIIVILQHSVGNEYKNSFQQMRITLDSIKKFDAQKIIIYPCSDIGYKGIIKAINLFKHNPDITVYKNLDAPLFLGLLKISNLLIGNSSCGIIESSLLKIPVINIGTRQKNRPHAENVIQCKHDKKAIIKAIKKSLNSKKFISKVQNSKNIYGDGKTGLKIVKILSKIKNFDELFEKRISY
ncbi:MAG: UDP-N-acetylglucosamine 2-epimerase (hydrolyzing) [Pelagibacteraceae bacterium]|nr:UDP-N-acetylglucosamine 2-epimerase (hydrolyzing) [Pelagibacteraceae bacterium]|tara:strand:- start:18301 stop:19455 length:1155 start_codon:yes stop_codon:yes gene_type:complete